MSQYDLEPKSLPFALASKDNSSEEELERSGNAIVTLIGKAADAAKTRSDHARDVAQKLSAELGRLEKRVRELEAEVSHYRDRATRAEDWLLRVSKEIEEQFFSEGGTRPRGPRPVG
jgi:predicted  nucleic acid-binding Zn-ribbon protein